MAKFDIYSSLGVKKAEGYLTFTGTYMKAGVLDFREIGSPTPIDWAIGDYVDYTRTGMRYYLYTIPPVKRQTRNSKYGGAFLYQNVQFHDASYDFEICPFRDLVVGDNRIHFSTQPAISVFDNVAGIAERLGACLDDMYPGKWVVRVASGTEYDSLMAEDRDFSVSGVSIKGALDKVYEVWPEVGWVYSYEQVDGVWKNVLTIGGAGLNTAASYQYSKGNGLTSLARTVANGDELANRLYVYGSNRNMLPRWYNSQNIKDADSVDIQHLMLPVNAIPSMDYSGWGKTNVGGTDKPDPAKAYIEDATSIAARGLRPKTVYFLPSALLIGGSIWCIIGSHGIMLKRNAGLSAAYIGLSESFSNYRKNIVEKFGKDADICARYNVEAKKIKGKKGEEDTIEYYATDKTVDSDFSRLFDAESQYWDKNANMNLMVLHAVQQDINRKLKNRRSHMVTLNEIYDCLDLRPHKQGQVVGFKYRPGIDPVDENGIPTVFQINVILIKMDHEKQSKNLEDIIADGDVRDSVMLLDFPNLEVVV